MAEKKGALGLVPAPPLLLLGTCYLESAGQERLETLEILHGLLPLSLVSLLLPKAQVFFYVRHRCYFLLNKICMNLTVELIQYEFLRRVGFGEFPGGMVSMVKSFENIECTLS